METVTTAIAAVHAMSRSRLDLDEVAAQHLLLRGHLAVLLNDARELAERMPRGGFDRHRMDIHIERLAALHARPAARTVGAAFAEVRQLVRACQWLLTQLESREPA